MEDTVLGEGGFSEVRSGVSKTALQQKVAVKIVDRKKLSAVEEVHMIVTISFTMQIYLSFTMHVFLSGIAAK